MALIDSLISYWKMDEASGNRSDSHGSNNLTDNNTVTSAAGKINDSAQFVGANSEFLSSLTAIGFNAAVPLTYNFWVNLPSTSQRGTFLEDSAGVATGNSGFAVGVGLGTLDSNGNRLIIPFWGVDWQDTGVNIGTGWHMVTIIITAARKAKAYIDGSLVFNGTSTMAAFVNGDFNIGRSVSTSGYPRYLSSGALDEMSIFDAELTGSEILELYNSGAGLAYPFSSSAPTIKPHLLAYAGI